MDDVASAPLHTISQNQLLLLRRCRSNSISTSSLVVPINLHHHHSSSNSSSSAFKSSSVDFDLISIKPISYTSLKDLLPSTPVNSPKPNNNNNINSCPAQTGSDISIKNRLVQQAAWAYLQPMSTSPDSSAGNFLHRLWSNFQLFLNNPLSAFRGFFDLHIFRTLRNAFDSLLRSIQIRSSS
ncbi:hypothetical protein ACH5RR_004506 [Cinchona calisaya]|uniref:Uncharacterized protein n=1 Tax=Cinchona calisaya TaxID=153742 RepID=A0ABD3AY57_9GENT